MERARVDTKNSTGEEGFTLVELLVVMAILAILAGLLAPTLSSVRGKQKVDDTKTDMQAIALALESYSTEFGDYPPTRLTDVEEWRDISSNGINEGNESMLGHLMSRRRGGPFLTEYKEDRLANIDEDSVVLEAFTKEIDWEFGDAQLREYTDSWGNPYVYIHNRDYEDSFLVTDAENNTFSAMAGTSAKTATYYWPSKYQLWSIGKDGVNSNGSYDVDAEIPTDDLGIWK